MVFASAIMVSDAWNTLTDEISGYFTFLLSGTIGVVLGLAIAVFLVFWVAWKLILFLFIAARGIAPYSKDIAIKAAPTIAAHGAKKIIDQKFKNN